MTPILQGLIALTICVLFCFFILSEVALVVANDFSHMTKISFRILLRVFLGVLLQSLNDLAAAGFKRESFVFLGDTSER